MSAADGGHRPGSLKQQNKGHKGRHSKRFYKREGRLANNPKATTGARRASILKDARRLKARQQRMAKTKDSLTRRRAMTATSAPPCLVLLLPICGEYNLDPAALKAMLVAAGAGDGDDVGVGAGGDATAAATAAAAGGAAQEAPHGLTTFYNRRLKQRAMVVVTPPDVFAFLELAKVADVLMCVWAAEAAVSPFAQLCLSCLLAQGVPATTHVLHTEPSLSKKAMVRARAIAARLAQDHFPSPRIQSVSGPADCPALLWSLLNMQRSLLSFSAARSHLLVERAEFQADAEGETGTLAVTGYVRGGRDLDIHRLLYLPGFGAVQAQRVVQAADPCPATDRRRKGTGGAGMAGGHEDGPVVLAEASPDLQESLQSEVPVDPLAAEQTWPTPDELAMAEERGMGPSTGFRSEEEIAMERAALANPMPEFRRVPKGTSSYQAAWIIEEGDGANSDGGLGDLAEEDAMAGSDDEEEAGLAGAGALDFGDEDDDEEGEHEMVQVNGPSAAQRYDEEMDFMDERDQLAKIRAIADDEEFPDEIDTPQDVSARSRFFKYRGLQSFRHSPWDPRADLPLDFARIFKFQNFKQTTKRVLGHHKASEMEEVSTATAARGQYVTVFLRGVSAAYVAARDPAAPLIIFGLLEHENKQTVLHFKIKIHPTFQHPLRSKEQLVALTGVRTFATRPVFSTLSRGDKHKFLRYLHPGDVGVASVIAPVHFPPAPLLFFKEIDGAFHLAATGSLLSVTPDRMVIKRIRLSGFPFKINKRSAVVRYMFFDPEDIHWFKKVELCSKYGRRGHIKESLGTHGHMKCMFDGPLRAEDTVMMNLYKRVYPKWSYEELGPGVLHGRLAVAPAPPRSDDEGAMAS